METGVWIKNCTADTGSGTENYPHDMFHNVLHLAMKRFTMCFTTCLCISVDLTWTGYVHESPVIHDMFHDMFVH
jgi:hypothetical protein